MRAARTHSAACRAKSDRHLFTVSRGSPRLVASPRCHDTRRRSRSARLRARVCARLRSSRQRSQEAGVRSRSKRTTVKRSPHSLHRALRSFISSSLPRAAHPRGVSRGGDAFVGRQRRHAPSPLPSVRTGSGARGVSPASGRPVWCGRPPSAWRCKLCRKR